MAVIHETLTLEDKFTNVMTQFLQLGERMSGQLDDIRYSMMSVETATASAAVEMQNMTGRMAQTTNQGSSLLAVVRNLAGAFLGMQSIQWLVGTSDQLTQINARLQLMTGSAEAAAEANEQIYQAAMRARGSYTDMADLVSQLGTLAPDAFSDTGEIVAFAEQLQKQMALSGTSTMAAQAAMLQLTQGLSSGALRGEELNSVLEQTPMIAQSIAEYMGVSIGEMRELASQGAITADVVKNAVFDMANEIDTKFEQMPMTWSQVWTTMQNVAIQALQPVLDGINFLANNMEIVIPIVAGATAAMLAFSAASWVASGGIQAIVTALTVTNPAILAISVAIGLVISAIAVWVQSIGGLEIAWLTVVDNVLLWWDNLKIGFLNGIYAVQGTFVRLFFAFQAIGTDIVNFFGDIKVDILSELEDLVNGAIDKINGLIMAVNKIPGIEIDTIDSVTFAATAAIENEAAKQARNAQLAADEQKMARELGRMDSEIGLMTADAYARHYDRLNEITLSRLASGGSFNASQYTAGITPYDEMVNQLGDIGSSVKGIEKSVNMSDEDIKALVDVAERRYVNQVNLTSQTPVITVNGANTGRTAQDRRALAAAIEQILLEEWASGSVRSTAYA